MEIEIQRYPVLTLIFSNTKHTSCRDELIAWKNSSDAPPAYVICQFLQFTLCRVNKPILKSSSITTICLRDFTDALQTTK